MKNILIFAIRFPGWGGIETVTELIGSQLNSGGYAVSVITQGAQERPSELLKSAKYYKMPNENVYGAPENYSYMDKVLTENHFDVVVFQDSYAPVEHMICELCDKHHLPLYVFEHNSPLFIYNKRELDSITTPKGFLRRMLHPYLLYREKKRKRYLLEHSNKYVLLSKQFIPEFCHLIGASEEDERITYINNPVVPAETKADVAKENIILCVCQLGKAKGVDKMLRIWQSIAQQLPEWRFVIVGDGVEKTSLERMVQEQKIPKVEFTGFAKPTEHYQRASIFWMTSKFEGWPMTLFEAMQQGCVPVVFKTFSSVVDIVDEGQNGFLVAPDNYSDFAERTIRLAKGGALRQEMSRNGIEKAKKFEVENIVKDWVKLLEE